MPIQQTSILAFHDLTSNKLGKQYNKILSMMEYNKNYTNRELSNLTGLPISSITARVNELRKEPNVMLVYDGNRLCKVTGKTVMSWRRL